MNINKTKLSLLIVLVVMIGAIHAQPSNNLAKKFVTETDLESLFIKEKEELLLNLLDDHLKNIGSNMAYSSAREGKSLKKKDNAVNDLKRFITTKIVQNEIIVMNRVYSPEEIKAMNEFYRTEIGQRILKKEKQYYSEFYKSIENIVIKVDNNQDIKDAINEDYSLMIMSDLDKYNNVK